MGNMHPQFKLDTTSIDMFGITKEVLYKFLFKLPWNFVASVGTFFIYVDPF